MSDAPETPGALWDRASLPSRTAIARSCTAAGVALAVGTLLGLIGGWRWAVSVLLGGGVVLLVLWGSARLLTAGARRVSPPVALLLAVGLYLVTVVGLFALAVTLRPTSGGTGTVEPAGVGAGVLGVVIVWSAALVTVHVRHDCGPRRPRL